MKTTIKVKLLNENCGLSVNPKGDWIDLRAAESITLKGLEATVLKRVRTTEIKDSFREIRNYYHILPLGVAIKLPEGFEAIVAPRSSIFKNFKCIVPNSIGIIDNCYCSNTDQWCLPIIPLESINIIEGDRICQFKIQLSQKATIFQKIKWLFSDGIEIEYVDDLGEESRGGFGSSGVK